MILTLLIDHKVKANIVSLDLDIVLIDSASCRLNKIQYNLIMHLFRIHLLDMIVCEYEHAAI
jgi:hypothetical protein